MDSCLDGEEACYYMEEGLYDLILLDRMLPKLDGIGVLTEMRKKGDMTPVIMLTALGALTDKITGLDCGADDYLVKPFDFEELAARIRSIGRRPRRMEATEKLTFADISYEPVEARLTGPEDTWFPLQTGRGSHGNLSAQHRPVPLPPDSAVPGLGAGYGRGGGKSG